MAVPLLTVEFAPGFTWQDEESSLDWVDITEWVMFDKQPTWSSTTRRSEFDRFTPGKASLTLQNKDRRFDPDNADGPYFGFLVPEVPIRILGYRAAGEGTDYWTDYFTDYFLGEAGEEGFGPVPLWRGFVDDWKMSTPTQLWAEMPISCTTGDGILARCALPTGWYAMTVMRDLPAAYWRMGAKADGDTMLDSSGNGADGILHNATFQLESLVGDSSDKAVSIEHEADARGEYHDLAGLLPSGPPVTLEAWVQGGRQAIKGMLFKINRDAAAGTGGLQAFTYYPTESPDGELNVRFHWLGDGWHVRAAGRIDDGRIHHVVVVVNSTSSITVYIDGTARSLTTLTGSVGATWPNHKWWEIGNSIDTSAGDFGLGMSLDEFAVYDYALSAGQVAEHYRVGRLGADTSGEDRIDAVLDHVGWPSDQRDITPLDTLLGPNDTDLSGTANGYLQRIDLSEQGRQFIDQRGRFTQRNRYWYLSTQTTAAVTLSDDEDDATYSDPEFGSPREFIRNSVTGGRDGGPVIEVRDEASVTAYGESSVSFSGMFGASDDHVRSTFEYIVARYKDPKTRVTSLTIDLNENEAWQEILLGLWVDDRVVVEITPASSGDQSAFALAVDGVSHKRTALEWFVTLQLSPVDTTTTFGKWDAGLWDTAVWA